MKTIKGQFRQGDVLINPVAAIPTDATDATPEGRVVLAYGEVTGHAHAIAPGEAREFTKADAHKAVDRFLSIVQHATVKHEEHTAIPMPHGISEIITQREYHPEAIRNVAD